MAVVNTKSTAISNADATPSVANDPHLEGGRLRCSVGKVEVAAADDNNSIYRFCRLPSNAIVHKIEVSNDAITSGTDFDMGLYETADNGGAAKDANLYADAIDLSSAGGPTDRTYEAEDINDGDKRIFDALGDSTDPFRKYDLGMIGIAVGSGAGTILVRVYWAV